MPRWDDDAELMRKAVRWALLDAWNATVPSSYLPPPDFTRQTGNVLRFTPGDFADKAAALLIQRGLKIDASEKSGGGTRP